MIFGITGNWEVVGGLGTVDQLIIDKSIMEEVKTYHRNLAVAFYNYKKAYDKFHHDWLLRVYKWIGIPDNVITLLSSLMRKWKTRQEIWKDGKKSIGRWIDIMCSFFQVDSYSPFGFCISEIQYVNYSKNPKDAVWDTPERCKER